MTAARCVSAARLLAYEVLRDVAERDAYANLVLPGRIARAGLDARDAAFATELVSGTLRMQGRYDRMIELAANREVTALDPRTLRVLRLGVHQVTRMRVAPHAAVSESVDLQRAVASARGAGFVNGVLRAIGREPDWDARLTAAAPNRDAALAAVSSHPVWVVRALRRALAADRPARGETQPAATESAATDPAGPVRSDAPGDSELRELLDANNAAPRVNFALLGGEDLEPDLIAAVCPTLHPRGPSPIGWELDGGSPASVTAALHDWCAARVQDQGSQLAALSLVAAAPVAAGERWLDLCAGPGGKTALLAHQADRLGASLRANEVAPHRADLVRAAVSSVSGRVTVVSADGRAEAAYGEAKDARRFDRILVDAPCSGLGALRRRPEARWRKQPADIGELTRLQSELLAAAIAHLTPGGVVAYVTCSPHLAETRAIVDRALREQPVTELDAHQILREIAVEPLRLGAGPHAQLWPHRAGTDAMFVSLLRRADC